MTEENLKSKIEELIVRYSAAGKEIETGKDAMTEEIERIKQQIDETASKESGNKTQNPTGGVCYGTGIASNGVPSWLDTSASPPRRIGTYLGAYDGPESPLDRLAKTIEELKKSGRPFPHYIGAHEGPESPLDRLAKTIREYFGNSKKPSGYGHPPPAEDQKRLEEKKKELAERIDRYYNRLDNLMDKLSSLKLNIEERLNEENYLSCCRDTMEAFIFSAEKEINAMEEAQNTRIDDVKQRLKTAVTLPGVRAIEPSVNDCRTRLNKIIDAFNRLYDRYRRNNFCKEGDWPGILHGHTYP